MKVKNKKSNAQARTTEQCITVRDRLQDHQISICLLAQPLNGNVLLMLKLRCSNSIMVNRCIIN